MSRRGCAATRPAPTVGHLRCSRAINRVEDTRFSGPSRPGGAARPGVAVSPGPRSRLPFSRPERRAVKVERCAKWPACDEHRELADLLGHDYQGHVVLNALVHTRVTTVAEVAELSDVDLLDVRHLGPARIALIRQRLTRTTTEGRR